jgi:hypothetical protein
MSTPIARYTVEYRLAGRIHRMTVQADSPHHACRIVELRTGGTRACVVGRAQ